MSKQNECQTKYVGAQFGPDEIAAMDYYAALRDPVKPNRSHALRQLVGLGYTKFREQRSASHQAPPPDLGPVAASVPDVSSNVRDEQHSIAGEPASVKGK
ncbi:MAG TPA: hypothetical protein VM223_08415 [Planctomycetota bacterium]|nr:hypothetical protein [Planctomycetota bacterium]